MSRTALLPYHHCHTHTSTCAGSGVNIPPIPGPQTDCPEDPLSGRVEVGDFHFGQVVVDF